MAQNLVIDGNVFNGVDSISMTNEAGEKVTYIEKTNPGTGVSVAQIGERQFYTVEEALAAAVSGDTVMLIADAAENVTLVVSPGVTLDLNGKDLEADSVVGMATAHVIDSLKNKVDDVLQEGGILKVGRTNLRLDANNRYMPIWNGTDGYVLSQVAYTDKGITKDTANDSAKLTFVPWFEYVDEDYVMNNAANTGVKVLVRTSWNVLNDDGTVKATAKQDYVFSDATTQSVVKAAGKKGLAVTMNGVSSKAGMTMTAMVMSDTGAVIASTEHIVTPMEDTAEV